MEKMDLRMVVDGAIWYVSLFEAYPQWDVLSMVFFCAKKCGPTFDGQDLVPTT